MIEEISPEDIKKLRLEQISLIIHREVDKPFTQKEYDTLLSELAKHFEKATHFMCGEVGRDNRKESRIVYSFVFYGLQNTVPDTTL